MKKANALLLVLVMFLSLTACAANPTAAPAAPVAQAPAAEATEAATVQSVETEASVESAGEAMDNSIYTNSSYWLNLSADAEIPWVCVNARSHKVGIVTPNLSTEFYIELVASETKYFEEAGYTLSSTSVDDDPSAAMAVIESWVMQGYDAIVFHGHTSACDDALQHAMDSGVLVVSQSQNLSKNMYNYYIAMDNYDAAYMSASYAAEWANAHVGDRAQYILIERHSTDQETIRAQGLEAAMADNYPNGECVGVIDVLNAEQTRADIDTLLVQYPDVKFISAYYCDYALIGLEAAKAANMAVKDGFGVFGVTMNAQVLDYLTAGDTCYEGEAWIGDQAYMQFLTVTTLLDGGSRPHIFNTPPYLVTHDNIKTYYDDYYANIIKANN